MTPESPDQTPNPSQAPVLPVQPMIPQMPMSPHHNRFGLTGILLVVLGLGTVVFATLAIMAFDSSSKATSALKSARANSFRFGQEDQKKADDLASTVANESPFRSYIAPDFAGGFEIKFPKNWSANVQETESSTTQVVFFAQPNFVKFTTSKTIPDKMALSVTLIKSPLAQTQRRYDDRVKAGKMKSSTTSVSGIAGMSYNGKLDEDTSGLAVMLGVRDKTLIFESHNEQFKAEFAQILSQAHIIP